MILKAHLSYFHNLLNAEAKLYIENNIELLEEDITKFIQKCPDELKYEVIDMLKKADIEIPEVTDNINIEDPYINYIKSGMLNTIKDNWIM